MFVITPPAIGQPDRGREVQPDTDEHLADVTIKLARHGWGYEDPVQVPNVEPAAAREDEEPRTSPGGSKSGDVEVCIPTPGPATLPLEGQRALAQYQREVLPDLADEPFWSTRVCWYADTPTGDFLVDFVPGFGNTLLAAGGGSGHAFKFVPVLGERVLERMEGCLESDLAELWRWRSEEEAAQGWRGGGDGSRGGRKGMRWEVEASREAL